MLNMTNLPTSSGSTLERIGEGSFPAVLSGLIDLGMQGDTFDKKERVRRELWVQFTLPTETAENEDGEEYMRVIGKRYSVPQAYNDKSALIILFNTLAAKGDEDISDLLAKNCLISIGSTSGDKDKITSVGKAMKGMSFTLEDDKIIKITEDDWEDEEKMDALPKFLQDIIAGRVQD